MVVKIKYKEETARLEVKSLNLIDKNCVSAFYETDKKQGFKKKIQRNRREKQSWHIQ